jgi:ribonuclease HI
VIAYIDGGARGNPGPAAFGVRIEEPDGTLVEEFSQSIGTATNNVAEYRGLIAALEWARAHGVRALHVRSDSLLLVQQMLGKYKVKNEGLQPLHAKARRLADDIGRVSFEHVGRALNAHADRLANEAMDAAVVSHQSPVVGQPSSVVLQPSSVAARRDPFSALEREVRRFVYQHFVETGGAPDRAAIVSAVRARDLEVIGALHNLADLHALVLAPATTNIWMAHPFSAVPTAYPVLARGRTYFANCAWDAAGILALVGDGESRTCCDDCGAELALTVRDGALHGDGVVHFAVPPRRFWENIAYT